VSFLRVPRGTELRPRELAARGGCGCSPGLFLLRCGVAVTAPTVADRDTGARTEWAQIGVQANDPLGFNRETAMNFHVTLLQNLPNRAPLAVQARYRLRDGTLKTWPVGVEPERASAVLEIESRTDMLLPDALTRSLVVHYPTAPYQEERQISSVRPAVEAAPAPMR